MTKKKLIDIMLENNVQWPEGADYAVQDGKTVKVAFAKGDKPKREKGSRHWVACNGMFLGGCHVPMPELCHNWHQTIVTREQYEAAYADKSCKAVVEPIIKSAIQECLLVSIIDKIAHHQSESQRHEEAMLDHNDKELALRGHLNDMLAKVGMKVVDAEREVVAENGGRPDYCDENGIVVDWDKVPVGVMVECINSVSKTRYTEGKASVVSCIRGRKGPVDNRGDVSPALHFYKFRLIK